jgi:hypothetical protein
VRKICIESFGVKVNISTEFEEDFLQIEKILTTGLGGCFRIIDEVNGGFHFHIGGKEEKALFLDGEEIYKGSQDAVMEVFDSKLRVGIACRADKTFIHAGAVGWKGKAIIFPGFSYKGKSALTAEFVKLGADYYSDEYAVLDEKGLVHPFPKYLSLRGIIDDLKQVDTPVESIGGKVGKDPIPIGMVLITEYEPGVSWNPEFLSQAQGMLEIVSHTVPFSERPAETLKFLKKALDGAKIIKQKRGEAAEFARKVLQML